MRPNKRVQRTRLRSPLTRHPLGGHQSPARLLFLLAAMAATACSRIIRDPVEPLVGPTPIVSHEDVVVRVVDVSSAPLPGALVEIEFESGGVRSKCICTTGSKGTAGFRSVQGEAVNVVARLNGFTEAKRERLALNPAQLVEITVHLTIAPRSGFTVSPPEELSPVSVTAPRPTASPIPMEHTKCS